MAIKQSLSSESEMEVDLEEEDTLEIQNDLGNTAYGNGYLEYDPLFFSPLQLYRPQADVVASLIARSGNEGVGRRYLGKKLGLNTRSKVGNRKISKSILNAVQSFPDDVGQFQKMEGKYRMIKYYYKGQVPERFTEFFLKFKEFTGVECPFEPGAVIKFPHTNLNTLRISDVTMKRMLYILRWLKEEKALIALTLLCKRIHSEEARDGYPFLIDKKSLLKCLLTLQKFNLCRLLEMNYTHDNLTRTFEVAVSPDVESVDDNVVQARIKSMIEDFNKQGRTFPSGQPCRTKVKKEPKKREKKEKNVVKRESKPKVLSENSRRIKLAAPIVTEKSLSSLIASYKRRGTGTSLESFKISAPMKIEEMSTMADEQDVQETEMNDSFDEPDRNTSIHESERKPMFTKRRRIRKSVPGYKNRPLDDVDITSKNLNCYHRSRFTQYERDMLIAIRAVSFFLNPGPRLWFNPVLMRDIMHEYAPESRTKTTNSLMATGVRDLGNPRGMEHMVFVVKNMDSFEEMRELRVQGTMINLNNASEVADFFRRTFKVAHGLLYKEDISFPSISAPDFEFERYLSNEQLEIGHVKTDSSLKFSQRVSIQTGIFKLINVARQMFSRENITLAEEDDVGSLMVMLQYLGSEEHKIDFAEPDKWNSIFETSFEFEGHNTTKQMRYLEDACMNLESVQLFPTVLPKNSVVDEVNYCEEKSITLNKKVAEALLTRINISPGISIDELIRSYHDLEATVVEQMLCSLETLGCCFIRSSAMKSMKKTSPFEGSSMETIRYVLPTHGGLEKFAALL